MNNIKMLCFNRIDVSEMLIKQAHQMGVTFVTVGIS